MLLSMKDNNYTSIRIILKTLALFCVEWFAKYLFINLHIFLLLGIINEKLEIMYNLSISMNIKVTPTSLKFISDNSNILWNKLKNKFQIRATMTFQKTTLVYHSIEKRVIHLHFLVQFIL